MSTRLAVVVCAFTERRWDDLVAACASLLNQTRRPEEIILVIDHNDFLQHRALAHIPDVRVVSNLEAQGLSGARNTGVHATSADIVLFLDDDATADEHWVQRMVTHLDDPAIVGTGGYAVPNWDGGASPAWFPVEFLWVVGCSYEGLPGQGETIRNPIGCAMAFRRSAIVEAGGFSTSVGRLGSKPLGCEETELSIRIAKREPATRIVHAVSAVVHHRVPRDRQSVKYFARRCFWEGVSKSRMARLTGAGSALSTERGYVLQTLTRGVGARLDNFTRDRSLKHLSQSLAMMLGVGAAGLGYLYERVAGLNSEHRAEHHSALSSVASDARS